MSFPFVWCQQEILNVCVWHFNFSSTSLDNRWKDRRFRIKLSQNSPYLISPLLLFNCNFVTAQLLYCESFSSSCSCNEICLFLKQLQGSYLNIKVKQYEYLHAYKTRTEVSTCKSKCNVTNLQFHSNSKQILHIKILMFNLWSSVKIHIWFMKYSSWICTISTWKT